MVVLVVLVVRVVLVVGGPWDPWEREMRPPWPWSSGSCEWAGDPALLQGSRDLGVVTERLGCALPYLLSWGVGPANFRLSLPLFLLTRSSVRSPFGNLS